MTAPATFKQADLERAFKAAQNARVSNYRINLSPGGGMEIVVGEAATEAERVELD